MAEVNTDSGGGGGKHQKKRAKKSNPRIDMTPMVDLAFLLLTFFILTANLSKPKAMEMTTPKDTNDTANQRKVSMDKAFTIILDKDKKKDVAFYYKGKFEESTDYKMVDFGPGPTGLRKTLFERNKTVATAYHQLLEQARLRQVDSVTFKKKKHDLLNDTMTAPFVIIKVTDKASYKSLVDVIDELNIAAIGRYSIDKIADAEMAKLDAKLGRPISVQIKEIIETVPAAGK
jgi:biopolymer transport protein ExbD